MGIYYACSDIYEQIKFYVIMTNILNNNVIFKDDKISCVAKLRVQRNFIRESENLKWGKRSDNSIKAKK